jgi:hypothetical protein
VTKADQDTTKKKKEVKAKYEVLEKKNESIQKEQKSNELKLEKILKEKSKTDTIK